MPGYTPCNGIHAPSRTGWKRAGHSAGRTTGCSSTGPGSIRRKAPCAPSRFLMARCQDVMARSSFALLGRARRQTVYAEKAAALHEADREALTGTRKRAAYIDGYVSGRRNVTRHANIFAVLYGFCPEKNARIARNALLNDAIDPITTPYFKFFELMALCRLGYVEKAQEMILTYWYPMLELGATSIWEQFDPRERARSTTPCTAILRPQSVPCLGQRPRVPAGEIRGGRGKHRRWLRYLRRGPLPRKLPAFPGGMPHLSGPGKGDLRCGQAGSHRLGQPGGRHPEIPGPVRCDSRRRNGKNHLGGRINEIRIL